MKRKLTFGLMLTCAFALTNCSEQIVPPVIEDDQIVEEAPSTELESEDASIPFEVYATTAETKTAANGNRTDWSVRDSINVFHSHNGGFSNDGAFAIRDVAEGLFGGRLNQPLADGQSHNWYFIYPYSSSNTTPTSATVTIGASKDGFGDYVQTQNGENKNHVAGQNYPMWGQTSTGANEIPKMSVQHLSALVALRIVNQSHGPIVINNAEIRANENVVGEFNVNLTNNSISYNGEGLSNSNCAKIELTNGVTVPRYKDGSTNEDGSVTLYLAVKPFTAKEGESLSILVNNSIRTVTKLDKDIDFTAGKITTLKIPIRELANRTATDGGKYLKDKQNCSTFPKSIINGKEVEDMFVIGSETAPGSVTISGKLSEVMGILPIGFYASSWNNHQGVMIVDRVKAVIDFTTKEIGMDLNRAQLAEKIDKDESFFVIKPYPMGVFTNSADGNLKSQNLVILDEEPLQKTVDEPKANTFIETYGITVAEVKMAIDAEYRLFKDTRTDEEKAAQAKFYKLLCEFSAQVRDLNLGERATCAALKLADCSVTLRTAAIGEEGADDPRIVMWGLDVNGAN